jgi:hypothetical protein
MSEGIQVLWGRIAILPDCGRIGILPHDLRIETNGGPVAGVVYWDNGPY